jgi:hypothetical protein
MTAPTIERNLDAVFAPEPDSWLSSQPLPLGLRPARCCFSATSAASRLLAVACTEGGLVKHRGWIGRGTRRSAQLAR